jgi:hypothetical protein
MKIGIVGVLTSLLFVSTAPAAPVTGPWTNATGQGDGPITAGDTASPIVGDGTANSAEGEMIDSPFPAVTLVNTGDRVELRALVTLSGTVNSAAGSGTPRTQFRFGLFDGTDDGVDTGWVGYYLSNAHGNGTPAGTLARKPVGNTSAYLSTTGQNSLASTTGDGSVFNDDTFTLLMTIQRLADDVLSISGSISGTPATNFNQALGATDVTASTLGTFTFDRVGFLMGGNLDADQASFSNVDVTFTPVPEPGAAAVLALGAAGLLSRRRRAV